MRKYSLGLLEYGDVKAYMVVENRPGFIHPDQVVSVHSDKQEALDIIHERN